MYAGKKMQRVTQEGTSSRNRGADSKQAKKNSKEQTHGPGAGCLDPWVIVGLKIGRQYKWRNTNRTFFLSFPQNVLSFLSLNIF
jgi:hypothetical protein